MCGCFSGDSWRCGRAGGSGRGHASRRRSERGRQRPLAGARCSDEGEGEGEDEGVAGRPRALGPGGCGGGGSGSCCASKQHGQESLRWGADGMRVGSVWCMVYGRLLVDGSLELWLASFVDGPKCGQRRAASGCKGGSPGFHQASRSKAPLLKHTKPPPQRATAACLLACLSHPRVHPHYPPCSISREHSRLCCW